MNFKVTNRAIGVSRIGDVVERWGSRSDACACRVNDSWCVGMAFQAKEFDVVPRQQLGIGRTMRCMTGLATFDLDRRMLENEWSLFVGMAFDTGHIAVNRISQGFAHKTTMLVMAIGTFHAAFRHFMVEWFGKSGFLFDVALIAHVRLGILEQKFRALGFV